MISNNLRQYQILVEFLGKALGPDYEIVLQDLTGGHNEIIAIANSQVSGRRLGSPLTNAALQMLSSKAYENHEYLCNYKGIAEDGRVLRSSTMFIKDDSGKPVALLCINFDDSRFREITRKLHGIIHPESFNTSCPGRGETAADPDQTLEPLPSITETFPLDISSLMQKIFDDCTAHLTSPAERLNQAERKDVISKLNEQGLFQLKGAISFVAKKFSCSNATIYRYLSEITS